MDQRKYFQFVLVHADVIEGVRDYTAPLSSEVDNLTPCTCEVSENFTSLQQLQKNLNSLLI